jgi:clan AA aspartic protease (TIGR02281 family)
VYRAKRLFEICSATGKSRAASRQLARRNRSGSVKHSRFLPIHKGREKWRMTRLALLLALLAVLHVGAASAEIYRWTDPEGNLHFTENLSQVPSEHREQALRRPPSGSRGALQTYTPPADLEPGAAVRSRDVVHIPFERRGTLMWVNAMVNDRHPVPFLIDTGASGVSLPSEVVAQLGIRIRPDTPRVTVSTANGYVRVPVVKIDSVQLGNARVEGLQATVNPSMSVGLLGGSFFNNYKCVITLVPNEGVRGGAAAEQWRERFHDLRASIDRLEGYLADRTITRPNRRRELETNLETLKEDLRSLEIEANHAGVPKSWRE